MSFMAVQRVPGCVAFPFFFVFEILHAKGNMETKSREPNATMREKRTGDFFKVSVIKSSPQLVSQPSSSTSLGSIRRGSSSLVQLKSTGDGLQCRRAAFQYLRRRYRLNSVARRQHRGQRLQELHAGLDQHLHRI